MAHLTPERRREIARNIKRKQQQRRDKGRRVGGRRSTFTLNGKVIGDSRGGGSDGQGTGERGGMALESADPEEILDGLHNRGAMDGQRMMQHNSSIDIRAFNKRYRAMPDYAGQEPLEPIELEIFARDICSGRPYREALVEAFRLTPAVAVGKTEFRHMVNTWHYRIRQQEWFKIRCGMIYREMNEKDDEWRLEARAFLREMMRNGDIPWKERRMAAQAVQNYGERSRSAIAALEKAEEIRNRRTGFRKPVVIKGEVVDADYEVIDAEGEDGIESKEEARIARERRMEAVNWLEKMEQDESDSF